MFVNFWTDLSVHNIKKIRSVRCELCFITVRHISSHVEYRVWERVVSILILLKNTKRVLSGFIQTKVIKIQTKAWLKQGIWYSLYQFRYNSLCISKYVSIQIQLALELYTLYTRTNTLVCIHPDTTLSVFLSMYQSR